MWPFFPFKKSNNSPSAKTVVTGNLQKDLNYLKKAFFYPDNKDLIVREIYIDTLEKEVVLLFMAGMVDRKVIEEHVIKTLIQAKPSNVDSKLQEDIVKRMLSIQNTTVYYTLEKAIKGVLMGKTIMLVDESKKIFALETTGYEHRSIDKPERENVIKGPLEGFVESSLINRSLIRRQLKSKNLITEGIEIGTSGICEVSLIYMKNIANDKLVERVKKRLKQVNSDNVQGLSVLEQHLEERPYSLIPTMLYTERPDRAVAFLQEGHIILIMDNSPACLVLPVTFWALFHTAEDQYMRWPYGNFTRVIRMIALLVAMFTPAVYLAITNFHPEMIPSELLLSIMNTREHVPFPAYFELIMLELAFEILREAFLRVPSLLGPTIGIVGALVLGQAAVEAGIVSPILIIIVAMTGLSAFAVADISFNFVVRIIRFIFMISALIIGLYGIALVLIGLLAYLNTLKSFGVPFMSPLAPSGPSSKDTLFRWPVWKQWLRPFYLDPKDSVRKKPPKRGA
ncbi:spore germination protein KA [Natronincola peptidivorans]|uniref:Spore germination protein KA n=1 Tax=Natronincola peptidivorans TaxID=426128 RepID=A0A1I0F2V9_9FIRM|nr:spore germination protein [Natronincola peptidivorans]SET52235.1 spore germination protein KA [Natronincola peptidivorans]